MAALINRCFGLGNRHVTSGDCYKIVLSPIKYYIPEDATPKAP